MVALDAGFFPADTGFLLLDIGPGDGIVTQLYARDRRVVGVERDEILAVQVAQRTSPWQLSSCRGDAQALPLRNSSVDGVIALEVLEHAEDPDGVLAETRRVLKPNGSLCVAVPTSYTEALYSRLHPRYMSNATHVRVFKKDDLVARLRRHGFDVMFVQTQHLEPALCWIVYAALRTKALPTGLVLEHEWVQPKVDRMVARVARMQSLGRVVPWLRERFGKSWYVYARKTA